MSVSNPNLQGGSPTDTLKIVPDLRRTHRLADKLNVDVLNFRYLYSFWELSLWSLGPEFPRMVGSALHKETGMDKGALTSLHSLTKNTRSEKPWGHTRIGKPDGVL